MTTRGSTAAAAAAAVLVVVGWLVALRAPVGGGLLLVLAATQCLLIALVVWLRRLDRRLAAGPPASATSAQAGGEPESRSAVAATVPAETAVLTWMRHEIRTPINAIVGLTDLLSESRLAPAEREHLASVRASADLLTAIINDIHDLCLLQVGRLRLDLEPLDLREVVEMSLDHIAARAAERSLDVAYAIDDGTPSMLVGDVVRLRQMLVTLLTNAVKRTRAGEITVLVSARAVSSSRYEVRFVVRDTGATIPDEQRARMFQSLDQVIAGAERPGDAYELGVALCSALAQLMGGTVSLDAGPGGGAAFTFTIVVDALIAEPPAYLRSAQQLAKCRVLVVDHAVENRGVLVRYLTGWGASPRATDSPREALTWIRDGEIFDVAIISVRLPDGVAAKLAAEVERGQGHAPPRVVMMYGPEPKGSAQLKRGNTLVQPVGPAQLLDVMTRTLERLPLPQPPSRSAPLRILLAEDNPVSQKVALGVLQRLGHSVDVAADGRRVLEILERQSYDAVLMDMQMPEMDGLTVTRVVCERWPPGQRPGIIAMSASEWAEDRTRWLEAGADAWISKSLPVEELQRALARATSQNRQIRGLAPAAVHTHEDVLGNLRQLETHRTPGLATQVFDIFLQDTSTRLAALREAVTRHDLESIHRVAHSLQGSAAMVGASSMARRCAELIGIARTGSLAPAEPIIAELEARFEAIQRSDTRVLAQDAGAESVAPRVSK